MAMTINDECVACGACIEDCPSGAISEGDEKYSIDASKCTECDGDEPQCASVCPSEAIEKA